MTYCVKVLLEGEENVGGERWRNQTETPLAELQNLENMRCVCSVAQSLNNAQGFISYGQLQHSPGSQRMK